MNRYFWPAFAFIASAAILHTAAIFLKEWADASFGSAARTAAPWLGEMVALIIAMLTALNVAATQEMAKSAAQMADETRRTREDLSTPQVVAYFTFERRLLMINIQNIGTGVARDVSAAFKPNIPGRRGNIEQFPASGRPIPIMRPGETFSQFVDVAPSFFSKDSPKPKEYIAELSYKSAVETIVRENTLDLSIYEGMLLTDEQGMPELVKQVEKMAKVLERITDLNSLHIKTPRDVRREWQDWREEIAEQEREELAARIDQQIILRQK